MSGHVDMRDALFAGHAVRCRYYPLSKMFNCAPECPMNDPRPARTIDNSGLRFALRGLQEDDHHWSHRPCQTCQAITEALGEPFGCIEFARRIDAGEPRRQGITR